MKYKEVCLADLEIADFMGAIDNWGSDPVLVEDEDQARFLFDFIQEDGVNWECYTPDITDMEDWMSMLEKLDLEHNNCKAVYVVGRYNEEPLYLALPQDWEY